MSQPEMIRVTKSFLPTLRNVAILWFISKEPSHGYSIIKKFEEIAPPGLTVTESRVYPGLDSLEKKGYLKSELDITISEERPRKIYTITNKGKKYLIKEANQVYFAVEYINKFLKKIKDDVEDL